MSADQHSAQMLQDDVASSLSPLADRMRPGAMQAVRGQHRVTRPGGELLYRDGSARGHSCVLWGPPGVGKTSVALLYAGMVDSRFIKASGPSFTRSAALATLEELSTPAGAAVRALFLDEIHRVTRPVQQLVATHLQRSKNLVVVGCTTENPSFELAPSFAALCKVHVLDAVSSDQLKAILTDAVVRLPDTPARRMLLQGKEVLEQIAAQSDGDARRALSALEVACELANTTELDGSAISAALLRPRRRFDKGGEMHYDQVSALFKSVRSTNPDAALYWLARMRDGGESVAYMARALTRMGLEDIGLADPRALSMSRNAWKVQETFGGELSDLALSQLALYLGATSKSNYTSKAVSVARARVRAGWDPEWPDDWAAFA